MLCMNSYNYVFSTVLFLSIGADVQLVCVLLKYNK